MKKILVTGGAGYIGSHTCVSLLEAGFYPVVVDNLSNSSEASLQQVERITGKSLDFIKGDILYKALLDKVFDEHEFFAVMHFAGLKAVGESVQQPLRYYQNNVAGTLNLLEVMNAHNVKNIIFSSSATVYGDPERLPITEDMPRSATNPYGQSKLMIEHILEDVAKANTDFNAVSLRYFNPVGAHKSGLIGENPNGIPNNLMPYINQVAVGNLPQLSIFGNDYDTIDGTGVRDFIHVVDLAKGHVSALNYLEGHNQVGFLPVNLGTGTGTSVLQLVNAFIKNTGQNVPYQFAPRRAGDVGSCYAAADKAKAIFGWQALQGIDEMCADTWRWESGADVQ
ncbi:MAG: UDP-glucose 4-epimerase GalE [Moraxella sp.]|nr:UDP-glucose 4-epimerase GalE [Moraxella sp.]